MFDEISTCENTIVECKDPHITIPTHETINFLSYTILAPISGYLSLMLIIGYIKYPKMRERPGDLILGIAATNLILSFHWFLSERFPDDLGTGCGCLSNGIVAVSAGFANYVYNLSFIFYLQQKLQNLLKQARIIKARFAHIIVIVTTCIFTLFLVFTASIGKNIFGTCSKKFRCESEYGKAGFVMLVYLIYEVAAIWLYYYIKKNFSQALASSNEAERFLDNYRGYLVITTIGWLGIAISTSYSEMKVNTDTWNTIAVGVNNFSKVLQGMVLTVYRYRDPLVRRVMRELMFPCCKRKSRRDSRKRTSQRIGSNQDLLQISPGQSPSARENELKESLLSSGSNSSRDSSTQTNIYERFSNKRKLELTYSVLSSLTAVYQDPSNLAEEMTDLNERVSQKISYNLDQQTIFEMIPTAKSDFESAKCMFTPVQVEVIAPSIFNEITKKEIGSTQIQKSLDFAINRQKIKQDNSGDGGKSGEFFFFTADKRLLIKSISSEEMFTLQNMLEKYYTYLSNNPESFLSRIYGIFKLSWSPFDPPLNLIIMRNICPYPADCVEMRFDMKGSKHDRRVLKDNEYKVPVLLSSKTLKDHDFLKIEQKLKVSEDMKLKLLDILSEDIEFLWRLHLIDYSLIVFIINRAKYLQDGESSPRKASDLSLHDQSWPFYIATEDRPDLCYNIGVIDFLQTYTLQKKMEKNVKKFINLAPNLDTSAQDPTFYKERFIKFLKQILDLSVESLSEIKIDS